MEKKKIHVEEAERDFFCYKLDRPYISAAPFIQCLSGMSIRTCRYLTDHYKIRDIFLRLPVGEDEIPLFPIDSFDSLDRLIPQIEDRLFRDLRKGKKRFSPEDYTVDRELATNIVMTASRKLKENEK